MRRTVLVVEDYDDTRLLMKLELEARGYTVVEATTGREAINVVERGCPDLILMDMSLPELDGLTATRVIHDMERCCHVPVIAVTAYTEKEYKEKALAAGCVDFISKPIDFPRLATIMQQQLTWRDDPASR